MVLVSTFFTLLLSFSFLFRMASNNVPESIRGGFWKYFADFVIKEVPISRGSCLSFAIFALIEALSGLMSSDINGLFPRATQVLRFVVQVNIAATTHLDLRYDPESSNVQLKSIEIFKVIRKLCMIAMVECQMRDRNVDSVPNLKEQLTETLTIVLQFLEQSTKKSLQDMAKYHHRNTDLLGYRYDKEHRQGLNYL